MPRKEVEFRRAIAAELDRLGVRSYEFGISRRSHQYVEFWCAGVRRRFHFPLTPSSPRAINNARSTLRNRIRHWREQKKGDGA